jgi:ubiquitin thioesterase OTU1
MPDVPGSTQLSDPRVNIRKGDQVIIARLGSASHAPAPAPRVGGPTSSSNPRSAPSFNSAAQQTAGSSMSSASDTRLPSVSMNPKGKVEDGSVFKIVDGSYLTLKVVPDDNSCLFNSIGCLMKRKSDAQTCMGLRRGKSARAFRT